MHAYNVHACTCMYIYIEGVRAHIYYTWVHIHVVMGHAACLPQTLVSGRRQLDVAASLPFLARRTIAHWLKCLPPCLLCP